MRHLATPAGRLFSPGPIDLAHVAGAAEGGVRRSWRWMIPAGLVTVSVVLGYLSASEWGAARSRR
jgi:hypothetical protein